MRRTWPMGVLAAGCLALAGCGKGGNPRAIGLTNVPLAPGARIAASTRSCDRGANAYCSIQLVVVGDRYGTAANLLAAEQHHLAKLGWSLADGQTEKQRGADSPGHDLRLTLATVYEDLLSVDQGTIRRTAEISRAMSAAIFDRAPAISLMLLRGSS